jgi:dipeptidyl aminopeptidase/acylaminoacyl peptidase
MDAEFGRPQWTFGMTTYAHASAGQIILTYTTQGRWHLARLDLHDGTLTELPVPYTEIGGLSAQGDRAVMVAGGPRDSTAIVEVDIRSGQTRVLRSASDDEIDPGYLSYPQPIEFPTDGHRNAHGLFYLPTNQEYHGPPDALPPLIVISHGGPTGATSSALRLATQYWTSRGFAVLDVNYGGSTGYGRAYRDRLKGQWGVVDVADCANGASYLAEQGLVDGSRMVIRGGSAGGFTTLAALAFRDVFRAGASYYGVSDLAALAEETHKFESRYLDQMIGPYPEYEDTYVSRSPIHSAESISQPVIFFQGEEDRVVPPNQAEVMVEALRKRGIPVAYLPFEGEQHGFRRAENIARSLEAELYFYSRVLGFELCEQIEPVQIANLD